MTAGRFLQLRKINHPFTKAKFKSRCLQEIILTLRFHVISKMWSKYRSTFSFLVY